MEERLFHEFLIENSRRKSQPRTEEKFDGFNKQKKSAFRTIYSHANNYVALQLKIENFESIMVISIDDEKKKERMNSNVLSSYFVC